MSRLFQPIPAKPAFGNVRANAYASDYIKNKKSLIAYRNNVKSFACKKGYSQGDLLNYNKGFYLNKRYLLCGEKPFNKSDLIAGNYATENLSYIVTVTPASDIEPPYNTTATINNSSLPFYSNYNIDPNGTLFGNTQCGINNWTNYMEYSRT
jgi:hypothetical protein